MHKCRDFAEYRSPNRRCVFFARQSSRVPNQSEKVGVSACVPVLLGSRESARAPARLRVLPVTERFHRTVPPVGTRRWKAQNLRALTLVRVVGSWRVPSNCPFAPFLLLFSFPPKHPQYRSHNPHTRTSTSTSAGLVTPSILPTPHPRAISRLAIEARSELENKRRLFFEFLKKTHLPTKEELGLSVCYILHLSVSVCERESYSKRLFVCEYL